MKADGLPPNDPAAEEAVLAALLLDEGAYSRVLPIIKPGDFFREQNGWIYEACAAICERAEPPTIPGVAHELERAGRLDAAGGEPYLAEIVSKYFTAVGVEAHARIVARDAYYRNLISAASQVAQVAYEGGADAARVYAHTSSLVAGLRPPETSDIFVQAGGAYVEPPTGPAWGVPVLDTFTGGIVGGELLIIGGHTSEGKALAADEVVPTPSGWAMMADLVVGDRVFGRDGSQTSIVGVRRWQNRPVYRVTFSDGTTVRADGEHEWMTWRWSKGKRIWRKRTTAALAATVRPQRRPWCGVPAHDPISTPAAELQVDPYVLGVWLGDGNTAGAQITISSPEITDELVRRGLDIEYSGDRYRHNVRGLMVPLRNIGVLGNKHIPSEYLRGSARQRLALLRGLMDTDGTADKNGRLSFANTNRRIIDGVVELVRSLGWRANVSSRQGKYRMEDGTIRETAICFTVHFTADVPVFYVARKVERQTFTPSHMPMINSVERIEDADTVCIEVDAPDHLFLAGRGMVPTHNSMMAAQIARSAAARGIHTAVLSFEMKKDKYDLRMMSAMVGVRVWPRPAHADAAALDAAGREIATWPLVISEQPKLTLAGIEAACRRRHAEHGLDLVIVDYLQLIQLPPGKESEATKIGLVTTGLKALARELDCQVVLISQFNRAHAGELRTREGIKQHCLITEKKYPVPYVEGLKGSSSVEQDADAILVVQKHWDCDPEPDGRKHMEVILLKNRNGPTGSCFALEDFSRCRFDWLTQEEIAHVARGDVKLYRALMRDQGYYTERDNYPAPQEPEQDANAAFWEGQ